jgi:hypothetical protein
MQFNNPSPIKESTLMNPRKTTIAVLAMLSASLALADDFKTINGKQYKNATISRVEPDGISVKFSGGLVKIPFTELPKDLQQKYNYDPEKAAAAQSAEMAVVEQTNQQVEESNKQRKEVEQQKALENQQSQLQQQAENLRAQIGGANNSARETRYGNVHERAKLGLGEIAAGGGVHATNAQSALRYDQWAKEQALAGNLAEAERYNAMADQVKERIPELRSYEKPLHGQSAQNASDSAEALRDRLNDVRKEKQRVTQELERKKAQRQP